VGGDAHPLLSATNANISCSTWRGPAHKRVRLNDAASVKHTENWVDYTHLTSCVCTDMHEVQGDQEMKNDSEAPSLQTVRFERTYDGPVDHLWDLWTTKDGFESWWGRRS
jgi:hypothetical protein